MAGMAVIYLMVGRSPSLPQRATLTLRPSGDLPEMAPEVVLPFSDSHSLSVRGYVELIRKAKSDSRIARHPAAAGRPQLAVLGQGAGAARGDRRLQDQRQARVRVARIRRRSRVLPRVGGRPSVYLLPSASLDLTGVASYEVFLRGTFDWIGTYPDFLHVGDYKTAVNTYLEKTFTPAHTRDERVAQPQPVRSAGARRSPMRRQEAEAEVRALIDQGPFQPVDALRVGLIDEVAYEDELDDLVPESARRRLHRRRGLRRGVVGSDRRAPPLDDRGDQRRPA